jgi:hypothetical protein
MYMAFTKESQMHIVDVVGLGEVNKLALHVTIHLEREEMMEVLVSANSEAFSQSINEAVNKGGLSSNG